MTFLTMAHNFMAVKISEKLMLTGVDKSTLTGRIFTSYHRFVFLYGCKLHVAKPSCLSQQTKNHGTSLKWWLYVQHSAVNRAINLGSGLWCPQKP